MDELIAINKVAAQLNISSRTLRYWESAGLFKSERDASSGWRQYDEHAIACIRVIDLLRRIDIPVNDIKEFINNKSVDVIYRVLSKQLEKLDNMRADLSLRNLRLT